MAIVIVETTYDPPLTDELRLANQERLDPCTELRSVRWVASYESADRRRKICVFEGPDAEAVREAFHSARIGFDRMWPATLRDEAVVAAEAAARRAGG
jgi:hypothetical protein